MHYHLEILMPPTDNVEDAVATILAPFDENNDEASHSFWDWYQIGGRYSSRKLESIVSKNKRDAFIAALNGLGVTVSSVQFGKQELSPASQITAVDALWREMCPGAGDVCPLFKHSGEGQSAHDVCRLDQLPDGLTAFAFIHAGPGFLNKLDAVGMYHQYIWNGVTHQKTDWGGNVKEAISRSVERCDRYTDAYKAKVMPQPNWLVVTVDYHT